LKRIVHFKENTVFGGNSEEVTPVTIPNTEVKLFSADGTAREAGWESRTPPEFFLNPESILIPGFFLKLKCSFFWPGETYRF
jgi:hypothetical protein